MIKAKVDNEEADESLKNPIQYAVITFLPKNEDGTCEIDLVPFSWLDFKDDNILLCAYPNTKKELNKRETYLQNLTPPKSKWPFCEIELISCTDTLERGKRHLKRAEVSRKVDTETTSDSGSPNCHDSNVNNIVELAKDDLVKELNAVGSMSSASNPNSSSFVKNKRPAGKLLKKKDDNSSVQSIQFIENQGTLTTGIVYDDILYNNKSCVQSNAVQLENQGTTGIVYDDILYNRITSYIDHKFNELRDELLEKMDACKCSTEYVIKDEVRKIKTQIVMNSSEGVPKINKTTAMEPFKNIFPISDYVQFLNFDNSLASDDKKNKLKNLFKVQMYGESDIASIIRKTLSEVINPSVQLNYSGTGRKVRGIGKDNFSSTHTYNCLKEVVEEKFGDSEQSKSLRTKLGNFLANAGDRDGGRRQRPINNSNN